MARYICTEKTFHNLRLFRIGDVYNGKSEWLPKNKEGDIRGFRLLDGDPPAKPSTSVAVKVNEKVAGETEVTEDPASTKATEIPKVKRPRPKRAKAYKRKARKSKPAPLP